MKVKTPDNANRTLMVEEAKTVDQLMDVICQRIGITNTQEYSLASPRKAEVENVDTMRETKARELDVLRSKIHTEAEGQFCLFPAERSEAGTNKLKCRKNPHWVLT